MKTHKYLDKILIIVFLLVIFIPNIGLIKKTNEQQIRLLLNREPYAFPSIHISELELTDFSEIEKWYADKILFITELSKLWSNVSYGLGISIKPGQAIIGKNKWLFLGNDYAATLDQYTGRNLPTDDEMLVMVGAFRHMNNIAQKYHIPFLVVVAPDKQDIYPENLPNYIGGRSNKTRLDMLDKFMPSEGIDFLDLRDAEIITKNILGKKYGAIYLAGDSHWNFLGAYGAYESIASYTRSHFNLPLNYNKISFKPNTTTSTDLSGFLQVTSLVSNSPIPNLDTLNVDLYGKSIDGVIKKLGPYEGNANDVIVKAPYENINNGLPNHKNVLLISDSFSNYLGFYFHNDFYNTIRIHNGSPNYNLSYLIEKYKPKLIVFQIVERSLINYSNNFQPFLEKSSVNLNKLNSEIVANIDSLIEVGNEISISGWGYIPNENAVYSDTYIELSGIDKKYEFLLNRNSRPDLKQFTNGKHITLSGFVGRIHKSDISPGKYKVSIIIKNNGVVGKKTMQNEYEL